MTHKPVSNVISANDLNRISTEQRNDSSRDIDTLPTLDIARIINEADATVPAVIASQLPSIAAVIDAIANAFNHGGRLIYIGAGTSGRLGVLDASECPQIGRAHV